jgi:peroxiredoxin/uncharacterized membrane protein YphA (DoxX/SURF4 family)
MKCFRTMPGLLIGVRLALALMFFVAAASKLAQLDQTRNAIAEFGIPSRLLGVGAIVLPAAEGAVAVLLLPNATARWGALSAGLLLVVFAVAIALSLARGSRPNCNCFGAVHSAQVDGWMVARNLALAAASALIVVAGPGTAIADINRTALIVIGATLLSLAVLFNGLFSWQLLQQNGRLLSRLRALEDSAGIAGVPSPASAWSLDGASAPQFELPTADGGQLSLNDLLAPGLPLGLIFSDADCPGCTRLAERLPALQERLSGAVEIAVITRDAGSATGQTLNATRIRTLVQRAGNEVAGLYHVHAVPSAVVIAADRTITGPLATGEDAVEQLLYSHVPSVSLAPVMSVVGANR